MKILSGLSVIALIIVIRMFAIELGANRNLGNMHDEVKAEAKELRRQIDTYLIEHKKARRYFN